MVSSALPPVTIGIPFYNAEAHLLDAIRSVFAQTHENWELILMDDGSTDDSLAIARSIVDPRVRVFSDGKNKRLAARLNEIHSLAQHDFVARMDADDMMATDRLEKQLKFLLAHPGFELVTTGVCSITDDSTPYGIRIPQVDHPLTPYAVLSGAHGIVHASIAGRKSWFARNPYDPADDRAQDYKLWIRSARRNDLPIGYMSEPLYYYREVGSMTPQKMLLAQRIGREVIRANGREMAGWSRRTYLMLRSLLKTAGIHIFDMFGAVDHIVRARSPVNDPVVLRMVESDISVIRNSPVVTV